MHDLLARLTSFLGYDGDPGWVQQAVSTQLDVAYRSPFQQALDAWGVVGVFGIMQGGVSGSIVPAVYVAVAADDDVALEVHRATWTQGIVPFLLIVTPNGAWSCDAFAPPSAEASRRFIEADRLTSPPVSGDTPDINHLTSLALRVSLSRAGVPASGSCRVDERLLSNLRQLSADISEKDASGKSLPASATNALIGRLLFMRFLRDRGTMPPDWMPASPADGTDRAGWLEAFWASLVAADRVFNGSAFPIGEQQRRQIRPEHADRAIAVIIDDATIIDGQLQLSFAEFRFKALRTETLSAVYELFLELSDPEKKGEDGAIYTPPHLADHVLQKVAAIRPMRRGDSVFDCAMGSGVFLVGAFRRIAESALTPGTRTLPLKDLHELARRSVWGIEKNGDACQVAALSLYLTMLDYADPLEVADVVGRRVKGRRVFPELVGRNLLERDFFDDVQLPSMFPKRFTHIIANPPWTRLATVGQRAQGYVAGVADVFTDHNRAAPAFMHKALTHRLRSDGVFGFVMSARAVISSAAQNFPAYLVQRTGLGACSNLSNLRRTLFLGAEHAALVLVGYADRAHAGDTLDVFMPSQTTQPTARDGRHWVIVEDRAECRSFKRGLLKSPDDLIDALMLPTADLRFREWIKATHRAKGLWTVGDAVKALDLSFTRGGTTQETAVPANYILAAGRNSSNYFLTAVHNDGDLFGRPRYFLPAEITASARPRYRQMFGGNIVLFARGTGRTWFVERPVAFNSSFYGIHTNEPSEKALQFLRWLSGYLNTGFARYCMSITGRDWAIDHRRLEKEQILLVPLHSEAGEPIPGLDGQVGASRIARLPSFVGPVWKEYDDYRHKLQNGTRSADSNALASAGHRRTYEIALGHELGRYLGSNQKARVVSQIDAVKGLGVVITDLIARQGQRTSRAGQTVERGFSTALAAFEKSNSNLAWQSSWLSRSDDGTFAIVKPLGRSYWTVERAFEDAAMVVADALSCERSRTQ